MPGSARALCEHHRRPVAAVHCRAGGPLAWPRRAAPALQKPPEGWTWMEGWWGSPCIVSCSGVGGVPLPALAGLPPGHVCVDVYHPQESRSCLFHGHGRHRCSSAPPLAQLVHLACLDCQSSMPAPVRVLARRAGSLTADLGARVTNTGHALLAPATRLPASTGRIQPQCPHGPAMPAAWRWRALISITMPVSSAS